MSGSASVHGLVRRLSCLGDAVLFCMREHLIFFSLRLALLKGKKVDLVGSPSEHRGGGGGVQSWGWGWLKVCLYMQELSGSHC